MTANEKITNNFDFYQKNTNKKNNNFKKKFLKGLSLFIGLQMVFAGYNVFRMQNYIEDIEQSSSNIYDDYSNMEKAMREGDQNKSIALFSKIKNHNTAITDLLIGGNLIRVHLPVDKSLPVEYTYKLTPETLKTLDNIYKNNWNSGVIAENKVFQNIKCFYGDLTCYIGRPLLQETMNEQLGKVNKHIVTSHYNFEHLDQFIDWQKIYMSYVERDDYNNIPKDIILNPGEKYANSLE